MVGFTHDESYTFIHHMRRDFWDVLLQRATDPNNHVLNSVAGQASRLIFGDAPWALRLPSVIAFCFFVYFGFRIMTGLKNKWQGIAGFIIMLANPYMLDFFSLSRGYAIGLACVAGSMYFAFRYIKTSRSRYLWLAAVTGGLTVLCHMCFLNFYLPLAGGLLLYLLLRPGVQATDFRGKFRKWLKDSLPVLVTVAIALSIVLPIAFKFKDTGELDFAGASGFWHDTVGSLAIFFLYDAPAGLESSLGRGLVYFAGLVTAMAIIAVAVEWAKRKWQYNIDRLSFTLMVLLLSGLLIWLQYLILGVHFPVDRLALFFYPLFSLLLVFLVDSKVRKEWLANTLLIGISVLCIYNFVLAANMTRALNWVYDADTKEMLDDLRDLEKTRPGNEPARLGITWLFEPTIHYYRAIQDRGHVYNVHRRGLNAAQDYYYIGAPDLSDLDPNDIQIIKTYPVTGNLLIKNIKRDSLRVIYEQQWPEGKEKGFTSHHDMHDRLMELKRSELPAGENVALTLIFEILFDKNARGEMILSVSDTTKSYSWNSFQLHNGIRRPGRWEKQSFSLALPAGKTPLDMIRVLVNNYDSGTIHVRNLRLQALGRP